MIFWTCCKVLLINFTFIYRKPCFYPLTLHFLPVFFLQRQTVQLANQCRITIVDDVDLRRGHRRVISRHRPGCIFGRPCGSFHDPKLPRVAREPPNACVAFRACSLFTRQRRPWSLPVSQRSYRRACTIESGAPRCLFALRPRQFEWGCYEPRWRQFVTPKLLSSSIVASDF